MNKTRHTNLVTILMLALSVFAVILSACSPIPPPTATQAPEPTPVPPTPTPIQPDYWPTDGWRSSTPEEQGMDSEKLAALMDYLQNQNSFDIHSLLIIRNGYVVTDVYFPPFAEGYLHGLASATKSFTSSLIGIAIDKGYIEGVEQRVLDFFPERTVSNLDANKEAMTLEDLLTMRSGFECNNADITSRILKSPDWVQFALDLPMGAEPGARWVYCNANVHLLSAILQETTGVNALAFAQEHLFEPLSVSDAIWLSDPQGNNIGSAYLRLTPHDMARYGYLFLKEGLWDGQQVVPAAWVKAATSGGNYGYLWWLKPSGSYSACGAGGQEIWVLPDQDMVVVMTGASGGGCTGAWGERLVHNHIIPAAESTAPLPPNPNGVAALESKIQAAAATVQVQPEPVPPLPELAQQVAGISYVFDDNPFGFVSLALSYPAHGEALLEVTMMQVGTDPVDPQFEWLLGLDNVPRIAPGRFGYPTLTKGSWEKDNVFVLQIEEIGYWEWPKIRLSLTFEGDQVSLEAWANGTPAGTLTGRAAE
ncbi:MAG: serine hydrolase [Chloroflexi bacterium]|nr:serine hydrolase [Chloroflexota bacterium]